MNFFLWYFIGAAAACLFTCLNYFWVKRLVIRFKIWDDPGLSVRKIHTKPTPLLGGVAVWSGIVLAALLVFWFGPNYFFGSISLLPQILLIFGASLILVIGGIIDDKFNLLPQQQIIFPLLACFLAVLSGLKISSISNPFGGYLLFGAAGTFLVTFAWLLVLIYTSKLLDGVDGLLSGVTVIAALTIGLLALRPEMHQPLVATLAFICAGAYAGFLIFNWQPAKMFLGEAGSVLSGFFLGVLSILAGSKIATALLVMGLPFLDMLWVISARLMAGVSPFHSDKRHLHHRLLQYGFSPRQTVLIYYVIVLLFGACGLFLPRREKALTILVLIIFVFLLEYYVSQSRPAEQKE